MITQKIPILITGAKGLIGSKITELYSDNYYFQNLDISDPTNPVDITNAQQVMNVFKASDAKYVLHLAAYTDVTGAWEQRGDTDGVAYKVNVLGTKNIIQAAEFTQKHLIHISTAYVFDGKKDGMYREEDLVTPIEWYGHTKAMAEEAVQASKIAWTILRIDQPFRSDPFVRKDIMRKIISNITSSEPYPFFSDHYIGPTFIEDFAKILDWVIQTETTGLYHASSGEKWSDFELAKLLNEKLHLQADIQPGKLVTYLKTLSRPYQINTALNTDKLISNLTFKLKTVAEAVELIRL